MVKAYIHIDSRSARTTANWDGTNPTEGSLTSTVVNCRSLLSRFTSKYVRISLKNAYFNMESAAVGASSVSGVDVYGYFGLNIDGLNVNSTQGSQASRSIMRLFSDPNLTAGASGAFTHNLINLSLGTDSDNGVVVDREYLQNYEGIAVVGKFNIYAGAFAVNSRIDECAFILEIVEEDE